MFMKNNTKKILIEASNLAKKEQIDSTRPATKKKMNLMNDQINTTAPVMRKMKRKYQYDLHNRIIQKRNKNEEEIITLHVKPGNISSQIYFN